MNSRKFWSIILTITFLFVQAGTIVGIFHVGDKLFAQNDNGTIMAPVSEEGSIKVPQGTFWDEVWSIVKSTLLDIVKQAFAYIHQTIVVAVILWISGRIRKRWVEFAPKLYDGIDKYMDKSTVEHRNALKEYINKLVMSSIEAVEASFVLRKAPLTEEEEMKYADKQQVSKEKAAAALCLIMKDLIAGGLDKAAAKDKTPVELVNDLLKEIELRLIEREGGDVENRTMILAGNNEIKTLTGFTPASHIWTTAVEAKTEPDAAKQIERYGKVVNSTIRQAKKTLPADYLRAINAVVDASY